MYSFPLHQGQEGVGRSGKAGKEVACLYLPVRLHVQLASSHYALIMCWKIDDVMAVIVMRVGKYAGASVYEFSQRWVGKMGLFQHLLWCLLCVLFTLCLFILYIYVQVRQCECLDGGMGEIMSYIVFFYLFIFFLY